jgi:hypothetical protein
MGKQKDRLENKSTVKLKSEKVKVKESVGKDTSLNITETDSNTVESDARNKRIRIDLMSKIFCTVYTKPMYLLSSIILAVLMYIISETGVVKEIGASKSYGIAIGIYLIIMIAYVFICRAIRKKNKSLVYKKLSVRRKVAIYLILLITAISVSILEPMVYIFIKYKMP